MPALLMSPREECRSVRELPAEASPRPALGWFAWPALLLLAGYLLFCHGCHGDEDNELFTRADGVQAVQEKAQGH